MSSLAGLQFRGWVKGASTTHTGRAISGPLTAVNGGQSRPPANNEPPSQPSRHDGQAPYTFQAGHAGSIPIIRSLGFRWSRHSAQGSSVSASLRLCSMMLRMNALSGKSPSRSLHTRRT